MMKPAADDIAAGLADELDGRARRAPGGDQVVDQQDAVAGADGVGVDLDGVDAVFELIVLADGRPGQLALLADRHEADAELAGHSTAEYEAARLDADDVIDGCVDEWLDEPVDRRAQAGGVGQQRGDVAELDAGLGIVGDRADETRQGVEGQAGAVLPVHASISARFRHLRRSALYSTLGAGHSNGSEAVAMSTNTPVTVTDVEIPFGRLVVIFIKWGLAAIPAAIIISIIISVVMMAMAGLFGGMGLMMGGWERL